MKRLCIYLMIALLLGCLAGCAAEPSEPTPIETASESVPTGTELPLIEPDAPAADALPDFTVETVYGEPFTLSDALQTHELVLINLFATWCPPCKMEFPYLKEAWEQEKDHVSVIALSVEPEDTAEKLRDYVDELGLTFPVGREEGTDLSRFVTEGIPTTLIVDRTRRVAAVEIGAKTSTQAFLDLFDDYTGADYDPDTCTYTVCAYDSTGYVAGVVVNFCTDTTCTPVTTTGDGPAYFTAPPARYHVQIVQVPDGLEAIGETDFYTEAYGQTVWIPLAEVGS